MNSIFTYIFNLFTNSFINDGFILLLLNVFIYLFLLFNIFGLFFLFDLRYLRTLNELKSCGNFFFITISLVLLLLSLAGIPPLLGFLGKFLLFIFLIKTSNWLIFFIISFVNFFVIYFYIQNLRFLVTKTNFYFFYFKNFFIFFNFNLILFLVLLNTLNFFGILFIDDIILYFTHISCFLFFN